MNLIYVNNFHFIFTLIRQQYKLMKRSAVSSMVVWLEFWDSD